VGGAETEYPDEDDWVLNVESRRDSAHILQAKTVETVLVLYPNVGLLLSKENEWIIPMNDHCHD
jgi:hypothetical protein